MRTLRVAGAVASLVVLIACTGAKVEERRPAASGTAAELAAANDVRASTATSADRTPSSPIAGPIVGPSGGSIRDGSSVPPATGGPGTRLRAPSFPGALDTVGITRDSLKLCLHYPVALAAAFGGRRDEIDIYWRALNDAGGIHGRMVLRKEIDDFNAPEGAVEAARQCEAEGAFLVVSGNGVDQIGAVRKYAEGRFPYLHGVAPTDPTKLYSFSGWPSSETLGRLYASRLLRAHRTAKTGVLYRRGELWAPQYRSLVATLHAGGVRPVATFGVERAQGRYDAEIRELKRRGATAVVIFEGSLQTLAIMRQARDLDFRPRWLILSAFMTMADQYASDGGAIDPPWEALQVWPAYRPGPKTGSFAPYADEMTRMERAYKKYSPTTQVNDLHWFAWMASKMIHALIEGCGRACTRTRLTRMMVDGWRGTARPACPMDFSIDGHHGGQAMYTVRTYANNAGVGWETVETCRRG